MGIAATEVSYSQKCQGEMSKKCYESVGTSVLYKGKDHTNFSFMELFYADNLCGPYILYNHVIFMTRKSMGVFAWKINFPNDE